MEMLSAADDSSGANPNSVKSDDSSPRQEGGRGSPPPNCAICLGTCRNKSFTDSCLHQFCFKCLLTWSKVKAECPLCKQNFKSIIHNVRSNHQYDEYTVEQRVEETTQSIDIDSLTSATRRFRYRTTLTLPRRDTLAIQQLLMQHYPFMADVFPPEVPAPPPRRRSPTTFRRTVYRHNLWARPLPDFTGRFRDCTPEFYRYNDSQMHRLVPWLSRELHYLLNDNVGHISYVLTRILELLPQYHINSPEFREAMQRYFGERTEHFLHELYCFASTPYDMAGYDRNVQYTTDSRISTMVNEVISSSDSEASVDSDIVMVSSSHPAEQLAPLAPLAPLTPLGPGPSRAPVPAPVYPQHYIPQPTTTNVIPIETISQSDTDDDDEVMVVGYIKPPQDRTPEVVDLLGSDSDVIVHDAQPDTEQAREPERAPHSPAAGQLLVKLSLKRHHPRDDTESADSTYRPSTRRRRRGRSNNTATTSDTTRTTPSPPPHTWARLSTSSTSLTTLSSPTPSPSSRSRSPSETSLFTDSTSRSSFSSYVRKKKLTKKKPKRKTRSITTAAEKEKKKKRSSRSRHRGKSTRSESRERRSKRKSHSGKGVKSSKKASETVVSRPEQSLTPPLPQGDLEQAGPSTANVASSPPAREPEPPIYRTRSHESRRLKSVVNVMFKNPGESSPGASTPINLSSVVSEPRMSEEWTNIEKRSPPLMSEDSIPHNVAKFVDYSDNGDSDSDDLPLNLSVQKTYTTL